jgi:hypothetical protein
MGNGPSQRSIIRTIVMLLHHANSVRLVQADCANVVRVTSFSNNVLKFVDHTSLQRELAFLLSSSPFSMLSAQSPPSQHSLVRVPPSQPSWPQL